MDDFARGGLRSDFILDTEYIVEVFKEATSDLVEVCKEAMSDFKLSG